MGTWQENWADYLVVILYLVGMTGISLYFSRDQKNAENYLLGGRQMPPWVIGLACMMSMFSSISIVMIPGEIINHGLTLFMLGSFLVPILSIPAYLLFAKFWFRLGSFTPYEYLEYRYDRNIRALVSFSSFYIRTVYIGMVIYTSAKIFEGAYNWPAWFSIMLVTVVGITSCFVGGSKAVVWTNVFQAFISFGGLFAVLALALWKIDGGTLAAFATAFADGHGAPQFADPAFYKLIPYERLLFWLLLWNVFNTVLVDTCSNQVVIQRILSTKNWFEGLKSQIYSNALGMLVSVLLMAIGLILYVFFKQNPQCEIAPGNGDIALFYFVKHYLPPPFSGLFMAAMLAAIISTVSGVVNSMAGMWLKEFHVKFINKKLDSDGEYRILRISTLVLGFIGCALALGLNVSGNWLQQSVSEVGTLFYLLGSAILPAYLFAVLSKRANSTLIWATTLFGISEGLTWNVWYALSRASVQAFENDPGAGFGWAGKLSFWYVVPFLVLTAVCLLPLLARKIRISRTGLVLLMLGSTFFGILAVMLVWYGYSNAYVESIPREKSFAFTIPLSFIFSFVALWFCPIQPKEKYQGLTLDSVHEPILADIHKTEQK